MVHHIFIHQSRGSQSRREAHPRCQGAGARHRGENDAAGLRGCRQRAGRRLAGARGTDGGVGTFL